MRLASATISSVLLFSRSEGPGCFAGGLNYLIFGIRPLSSVLLTYFVGDAGPRQSHQLGEGRILPA